MKVSLSHLFAIFISALIVRNSPVVGSSLRGLQEEANNLEADHATIWVGTTATTFQGHQLYAKAYDQKDNECDTAYTKQELTKVATSQWYSLQCKMSGTSGSMPSHCKVVFQYESGGSYYDISEVKLCGGISPCNKECSKAFNANRNDYYFYDADINGICALNTTENGACMNCN